MITNTGLKIYDVDNNWNKRGEPLVDDFSSLIIDKIKNIAITFVDGTTTNVSFVQGFEYDSEFNIVITDALFNFRLYNAFSTNLAIKKMNVAGIVTDGCTERKYYFETAYKNLKISRYNGGFDFETCHPHEYTFVDINEDL